MEGERQPQSHKEERLCRFVSDSEDFWSLRSLCSALSKEPLALEPKGCNLVQFPGLLVQLVPWRAMLQNLTPVVVL